MKLKKSGKIMVYKTLSSLRVYEVSSVYLGDREALKQQSFSPSFACKTLQLKVLVELTCTFIWRVCQEFLPFATLTHTHTHTLTIP